MERHRICLITFIFLAACTVAHAQPDPKAAQSSSEEMILFQELPSIFGASKYEQKPTEAPASISIVTSDEIQRYGYRSLVEILRSVGGFYATYDRNYSYVGVRGFDRPGDYDTRVLLLLDGHRLNDNVYDQAAIGTESFIDVDAIERIEIIRGPSSSLYGTNAFLAVINVITKSGRDLKGGEVAAEGASYDTSKGQAAYGAKLASGREIYLSGSYYDRQGQNLFYPEFNDPATNNGWARGADADRSEHVFGKMSSGNVSLEGGVSSRTKVIPTASFGTVFDTSASRTTDARAFLTMKYDREVTPGSRISGALSYDAYQYSGRYLYTTGLTKDYGYGQWWTAEVQSVTTFGAHHKVIVGGEDRYNTQQDQGYYQPVPFASYLRDKRQSNIWALYVQDEIRIGNHLLVNAGVRHDRYETFGDTTNPRLALIYGPRDRTALKMMYGTAFRSPNAYELYYNDGGFSQKSNPDLSPETIETYEVELEHTFRGGLRAVGSAYQYRIKNLISLETDPADLLLVFENLDRVRADGVEVELEGKLTHRLDGRISYAYQDSENVLTGDRLSNSPRHMAKLNLTTPLVPEKLFGSVEVQYLGARETLSGGRTGGYTIANVTLLSRNWGKGPGISLSVYNLFDTRYADPASDEHLQQVIPQDGRNVRFQVRYDF